MIDLVAVGDTARDLAEDVARRIDSGDIPRAVAALNDLSAWAAMKADELERPASPAPRPDGGDR